MKINVTDEIGLKVALKKAQPGYRAGLVTTQDITAAAERAERGLTAAGVPKSKRPGHLYRLYARDGATGYAILTRGTAGWFLTEVGREAGAHDGSRLYIGLSREDLAQYDALGITPEDFTDTLRVGCAYIAADGVHISIRGGIGGSAYVALVTGADDTYGLSRDFVSRDTLDASRSGRTGSVTWGALEDGIYQVGGFCTAHGDGVHTMNVFIIIRGGKVASLGQRRAAIAKAVAA